MFSKKQWGGSAQKTVLFIFLKKDFWTKYGELFYAPNISCFSGIKDIIPYPSPRQHGGVLASKVTGLFRGVKTLFKKNGSNRVIRDTLPETNIAPENGWLEDYFPFGKAYLQGLC